MLINIKLLSYLSWIRIKVSENSKGNGDVSAGTNPKVICGKVILNNKNFSRIDFNGRNLKGKLYM
tara:strand:+ start:158 stop:352 length:195 start_codon:yes stop_codon:yes gene_type:complete